MRKIVLALVILTGVFFSCMERPLNDGEAQTPDVKFSEKDLVVVLSIFTMENTEYLNILRYAVENNGDGEESSESEDVVDDVIEDPENIENIAELIPRSTLSTALSFFDEYVLENTSYRYCIRYRVNDTYYFSGWSRTVSVPKGKGKKSPPYIIKDTPPLNMEYSETLGTMAIKIINKKYVPIGDATWGEPFDEDDEKFNDTEIGIDNDDGKFNLCLVFHYDKYIDEDEEKTSVSRAFTMEGIVVGKSKGKTVEYYIDSSQAANYNISMLVSSEFHERDIVADGFIGEKVTEYKKPFFTEIVWTKITPVKLYECCVEDDEDDDEENENKKIQYRYKRLDTIKIPSIKNTDNKHDTGTAIPRCLEGSVDVLPRDFSTYYKN